MKWFVLLVALLHAAFMAGELFPWPLPALLKKLSEKLPKGTDHDIPRGRAWNDAQQRLVSTIVHNAGIYNAILAGGLMWAALQNPLNRDVARVLLAGAALAGGFGTATLKSKFTALQCLLGLGGLLWI